MQDGNSDTSTVTRLKTWTPEETHPDCTSLESAVPTVVEDGGGPGMVQTNGIV